MAQAPFWAPVKGSAPSERTPSPIPGSASKWRWAPPTPGCGSPAAAGPRAPPRAARPRPTRSRPPPPASAAALAGSAGSTGSAHTLRGAGRARSRLRCGTPSLSARRPGRPPPAQCSARRPRASAAPALPLLLCGRGPRGAWHLQRGPLWPPAPGSGPSRRRSGRRAGRPPGSAGLGARSHGRWGRRRGRDPVPSNCKRRAAPRRVLSPGKGRRGFR